MHVTNTWDPKETEERPPLVGLPLRLGLAFEDFFPQETMGKTF